MREVERREKETSIKPTTVRERQRTTREGEHVWVCVCMCFRERRCAQPLLLCVWHFQPVICFGGRDWAGAGAGAAR